MHTTDINGIKFIHNADGSGEIHIRARGSGVTVSKEALYEFLGEIDSPDPTPCRSLYAPDGCRFTESAREINGQATKMIGSLYRSMRRAGYPPAECRDLLFSAVFHATTFVDVMD